MISEEQPASGSFEEFQSSEGPVLMSVVSGHPGPKKKTPLVKPEPTGRPQGVALSCSEIQLSWSPSPTSEHVHYRVEYRRRGTKQWRKLKNERKIFSSSATVDGLNPETSYLFRVTPLIEELSGRPSKISEAVFTPAAPCEIFPYQPLIIRMNEILLIIYLFYIVPANPPENVRYDSSGLCLTWDPPQENSGDQLALGYLLYWKKPSEQKWKKVRHGGALSSHKFSFPTTSELEYCVAAESKYGPGLKSSAVLVPPCKLPCYINFL